MLIIRKCMFVVLAICIMGPLLAKAYAACTRECHEFQYAVAPATPWDGQPGNYCLAFSNDLKGGNIFAFGTGLPDKDNGAPEMWVAVWPSEYCSGTCSNFLPYVTGEPYDPDMTFPLGWTTITRYSCKHASY